MIGNEAAMGSRWISKALIKHTSEHRLKSILVAVCMASHLLDGSFNAHLAACNVYNRIDEVEIRQLTIRTVVNDVEFMIPVLKRVINRKSSLQRTRLERQRRNIL